MFSRPKPTDQPSSTETAKNMTETSKPAEPQRASDAPAVPAANRPKPSPSLLSSDLTIKGNIITSGDVQVEGNIEGDVHAHLLTVGENATVKGEIVADDVVVHGRVIGRLRGLKVRLTASARVEGDIVHKTIAIESGAHFEGSVQRQEDPIGDSAKRSASSTVSSVSASSAPGSASRVKAESRETASVSGEAGPR